MPETINVGDYIVTILPRLGGGTFGQVYKAVDKGTKEEVAVKQIQLSHDDVDAHDSRLHDMAQAEIDALRILQDHPNIVRLMKCITKDDSVFLVMEFCDLRDVSVYLKKNKSLNGIAKVKIMKQAAGAIAFMHGQTRPIIHRDIKLENILLKTENGEPVVKIADFGLAMLCDETKWGSKSSFANAKFMSSVVGTQYFQAPELLRIEERGTKYDASVDVFALGLAFEVIFDYSPEYTIVCPLSVSAKKSGRMINLGTEMLECRRKKAPPPVIEEILPTDQAWVKDLKNLLLRMTKYRPDRREQIYNVSAELERIYEGLERRSSTTGELQNDMQALSIDAAPNTSQEVPVSAYSKQWTREQSVDLPSRPSSLRHFGDKLFQCHRKGITVFDATLKELREIDGSGMGDINDVAVIPGGQLIVAANRGLFHITESGTELKDIAKGSFTGVVQKAGQVLAANCETCGVHIYEQSSESKTHWSQRLFFGLTSKKGWIITLGIVEKEKEDLLYVCLSNEHRVDVFSPEGKFKFTTGSQGSGAAGMVSVPFMGATNIDSNGGILIADYDNHRLQILNERREWSEMSLIPQVNRPGGAALFGGKLYVCEGKRTSDNYHLLMYK